MFFFQMIHNRLIQLGASNTHCLKSHQLAKRDNANLGRAAAQIDNHMPGR